jgi:hypothetical protein
LFYFENLYLTVKITVLSFWKILGFDFGLFWSYFESFETNKKSKKRKRKEKKVKRPRAFLPAQPQKRPAAHLPSAPESVPVRRRQTLIGGTHLSGHLPPPA